MLTELRYFAGHILMWGVYLLFAVGYWWLMAPESMWLHVAEWLVVVPLILLLRALGVGRSY